MPIIRNNRILKSVDINLYSLINDTRLLKKSIGTTSIKENSRAFLNVIPNNKATTMVMPDLDIPGMIANA